MSHAEAEHPALDDKKKRGACHSERCEESFNYYSWEFWEEIGHLTIFSPLEKLTTALFVSVFCFICLFYLFETGSLYVALTGLEVAPAVWTGQTDPPAIALREQ